MFMQKLIALLALLVCLTPSAAKDAGYVTLEKGFLRIPVPAGWLVEIDEHTADHRRTHLRFREAVEKKAFIDVYGQLSEKDAAMSDRIMT